MEEEININLKDISKGQRGLILMWALAGFIIGLLLVASFNLGQETGYNYVKNYYEDYYIKEYCLCYNKTLETKIVLPALEGQT